MPKSLVDWLSYLEQLHPNSIDLGLERVSLVAERLAINKIAKRIVSVTGTNGKGSTSCFLSSLLSTQNLRVGLYSSPHLTKYNERIVIAGKTVSDEELCSAFSLIEQARGTISLTYFEVGTLAAFLLFQQANLDVAIIEVGLGGRLDATNILDTDMTIVTNIAIDHTDWLGSDRESIAYEKSGLFRENKPVIMGDTSIALSMQERASELKCPIYQRGMHYDWSVDRNSWSWSGQSTPLFKKITLEYLPIPFLLIENAALALQAYAVLGESFESYSDLSDGLLSAKLPGRLEEKTVHWKNKSLKIIFDVGHNAHAAERLAHYLKNNTASGINRRAVFGLLKDKSMQGVIDPLLSSFTSWSVANLISDRTRSSEELLDYLTMKKTVVVQHLSIALALQAELDQAISSDEIIVFGSFYCVAEAKQKLDILLNKETEHGAN